MAPGTAPIPSRIENKGIQKPDNEITDITNGALRGDYGERFVQYSLRGCHLNENGSQSLPYRGDGMPANPRKLRVSAVYGLVEMSICH